MCVSYIIQKNQMGFRVLRDQCVGACKCVLCVLSWDYRRQRFQPFFICWVYAGAKFKYVLVVYIGMFLGFK